MADQKQLDLQSVINADLFSSTPAVADIKQVLQFMEPHAQPLSEPQIRAIVYLNWLGNRPLHKAYREANKGKHPYSDLVKWIMESAQCAANPNVFIRVIEALVPRPIQQMVAPDVKKRKER
jgi:hypothetical protein